MNLRSPWLWPLASGLALAAAISHPLWKIRDAQLTGDFLSHTAYQSFMWMTALLVLWRGAHGAKRLLWWPLLAGLILPICVEGLKRATRLPRPDGDPSGFPSGHTTTSFALAWLLMRAYPRGAPLWFGLAVSIGWSRIEGHAHFPYQVLCGAFLGTLIGGVITQKIAKPPEQVAGH